MRRVILTIACVVSSLISCEEIISVSDISEENVIIQSPLDNAVERNQEVRFSWESQEFADEYEIQVVTPSFDDSPRFVIDRVIRDSLATTSSFTEMLDPADYEWRIRAVNSAYRTQYTQARFKVDTTARFNKLRF